MRESDSNRGVSKSFVKDISERFSKLKSIVKDTGVEIPVSIESTLKHLTASSEMSMVSLSEQTRTNLSWGQEDVSPVPTTHNLAQIQEDMLVVYDRLNRTKEILSQREKENAELKEMISKLENQTQSSSRCCFIFSKN